MRVLSDLQQLDFDAADLESVRSDTIMALCNSLVSENTQSAAHEQGALEMLLDIFQQHWEHLSVGLLPRMCCNTIRELSSLTAFANDIAEERTLVILLRLLTSHDQQVVAPAAATLCSLSQNKGTAARISDISLAPFLSFASCSREGRVTA